MRVAPDPYPVSASAPMDCSSDDETFETTPILKSFTVSTLRSEDLQRTPALTKGVAEKLIGTRKRAAADHGLDSEALPTDDTERFTQRFHLATSHCSLQGIRPANEDCHIDHETPLGRLIGVCDGHGVFDKKRRKGKDQDGLLVAKIAAESAKEHLIPLLNQHNFQTQAAATAWTEMTHQMMPKIIAGTTFSAALIGKVDGVLDVFNVGDSKIVVVREHEGQIYIIPMSPIRDWSTAECIERVRGILTPEEFAEWIQLQGKHRRFPLRGGVNLSYSLGDPLMTHNGKTALSHEAVCSRLQLKPKDLVLCGCDGLFDYVSLQELTGLIAKNWRNPDVNFAELLALYALNIKNSTDNVTVVATKMELGPKPEMKRIKTVPILDEFY